MVSTASSQSRAFDCRVKVCFKDSVSGDRKEADNSSYNLEKTTFTFSDSPPHDVFKGDYKVSSVEGLPCTGYATTFFHARVKWTMSGSLTVVLGKQPYNGLHHPKPTRPFRFHWIYWRVFSIELKRPVTNRHQRLNHGGIIFLGLGNAAVDCHHSAARACRTSPSYITCLALIGIERLSPKVAADEFSLDGVHKADDLW